MVQARRQLPMTAAGFLAWDETQTVKHEFLAGEIYAMVGAAKTHGALTLNIAIALRQHLRGTTCSTFVADIKLQVQAANACFYPDVVVICSTQDGEDPLFVREPTLVVEVLSPSTAACGCCTLLSPTRTCASLRSNWICLPACCGKVCQRRQRPSYPTRSSGTEGADGTDGADRTEEGHHPRQLVAQRGFECTPRCFATDVTDLVR
jgi:Putative restriction endonuclease